jgi:hypothetical protein
MKVKIKKRKCCEVNKKLPKSICNKITKKEAVKRLKKIIK